MNTLIRAAALAAVSITVHTTENWWLTHTQPQSSTTRAVRQMADRAEPAQSLPWYEAEKNYIEPAGLIVIATTAWLLFRQPLREAASRLKTRLPASLTVLAGAAALLLGGCMRAYDHPEFASIDTAETGFLIPLEGNGKEQARFASEEYLTQLKVAAKRVQIPHRWQQTGRLASTGEWLPTVRLIKVERSPITREWTASANTGSTAKNQAIWIESADSVAFSMGFNCTAFIPEEQAARFLYWYPSGSLAQVMDAEVRARIQQVAAEVAAKYPLNDLRARKQEIMDAVRKDITAFFVGRGVTITTAGMFGGMTYDTPEIQRAIDKTFVAQQERAINQARFEAQQRENDRMELEASALAEKERRKARGEADAKTIIAAAEAQAIREVNGALLADQQSSLFIQVKQLEVEMARVEKWGGNYPQSYLTTGSQPGLLLQMPSIK